MANSTGAHAKRILRCFCGCTELTEEDVKRIYYLNAQATLIDRQASLLLHRFLEQRRSGDKNLTEQYLSIYDKCVEYLMQNGGILTLDEVDELSELGLPYHMEQDLLLNVKTGDHSCIEHCLIRIQGECRNEIESSNDFKQFKKAILEKLKYREC